MITFEDIGGESGQPRTCTQDERWRKSYTRFFRAITDDPEIGPGAVLTALGIQIGSHYEAPGEEDLGSFLTSISVTEDTNADDGVQWLLTLSYAPYNVEIQSPENPFTARPKIQFGSNRFQKPILFDIDGNPVVNTAFDFFEETPENDASRNLLTIVRNELTYNQDLSRLYRDTINNAPWFGQPALTWKCLDCTADMTQDQNGNSYWQVTYQFENKPETWKLKLLNCGYNELTTSGKRQIRDGENHPLTTPRPLNPDGTARGETALPDEIEFHTYPEVDFTVAFDFDDFYLELVSVGLLT